MEWTADVTAGDWIRERLDAGGPGWGPGMHGVVPRGFPAYARIFHRPGVAWVDGRRFPTPEELRESDPATWPPISSDVTTWTDTAKVFGTRMHATVRWDRIVDRGTGDPHDRESDAVVGPDGREYSAPQRGRMDADQLAAAAGHLAAQTATPGEVFIALWEGWGGVLGYFGEASSRTALMLPAGAEYASLRHAAMLQRSARDPFNNVFRKPVWHPGILDDRISRGPRLELPDRAHVLFTGGIEELSDPSWAAGVPWAEGDPDWTPSPSLLWPADRAWVLVTDVDDDSTIVGGSPDLVRALCDEPALEARALREGADLTATAEETSR